ANVSENAFEEMTGEHLYENAELVSQLIDASDLEDGSEALQSRIERFREPVNMRFTVIDTEGVVLADSATNRDTMDNHIDRPEIQDIVNRDMDKGEDVRYSVTEDINMMYVSNPIHNDSGELIGIIRISLPLNSINETMVVFWRGLAAFL